MNNANTLYITLDAALANGTLTESMLDKAVAVEDRNYILCSAGLKWIESHLPDFTQVVSNPGAFLWRHLDNFLVSASIIGKEELLRLIPEDVREIYLREVLGIHRAYNDGWVGAALKAGVKRESLGGLTLARLYATTDEEMSRGASFLREDFLKSGERVEARINTPEERREISEEIRQRKTNGTFIVPRIQTLIDREFYDRRNYETGKDTLWSTLTNEQLTEALRFCAAKSPEGVLNALIPIWVRLDDQSAEEILMLAVKNLHHVCQENLLTRLTLAERQLLCVRLKPLQSYESSQATARFILGVCLEMEEEASLALFQSSLGIFGASHLADVYVAAYSLIASAKKGSKSGHKIAKAIEKQLEKMLFAAGYDGGDVTFEDHRGKRQLQVRVNELVYVPSRDDFRIGQSLVDVGDRVIFRRNGLRLTPNVIAVTFIRVPTEKNRR